MNISIYTKPHTERVTNSSFSLQCMHDRLSLNLITVRIYQVIIFRGNFFFFFFFFYIYAFSRRFYPKRLTIAFRLYILISMCVPWESNPQPFVQLTQCSTTEPHRNIYIVFFILYCIINNVATVIFVLCNESNALKIKDASSYFFFLAENV